MVILKILKMVGQYGILMYKTFSRPDSWKVFFRQYSKELEKQGLGSFGITFIISIFIGAVITIQMVFNTQSLFTPASTVGFAVRDTMLLEFSSAILCLILAGKVGSNISSEIGSMRITEQIIALDIMGVNSANYLILPKIMAFVTIIPILVIFSMFFGLSGGYLVAYFTDTISVQDYVYGIQFAFEPFYITYSIVKSIVFAFIIASVSSYYGYYVKGGALEVGKASTSAVVNSSILILLFNLILTNLMLT